MPALPMKAPALPMERAATGGRPYGRDEADGGRGKTDDGNDFWTGAHRHAPPATADSEGNAMLETKPQYLGRAARPAAPRPLTPTPYTGRAATARAIPERAPLPERAPRQAGRTREQRMARSEARLLAGTVGAAVLVCGLLVVYLAAYARVTTLGIAQSKMRTALRAEWQENQLLRAQEAALKSPYRIADRAERLGLTKKFDHVDYYLPVRAAGPGAPAPIPLGAAAQADAFPGGDATITTGDATMTTTTAGDAAATRGGGEAGPQRTDSGPAQDDNAASRHD